MARRARVWEGERGVDLHLSSQQTKKEAFFVSEGSLLRALVEPTTDTGAFVLAFRETFRAVLQAIGADPQWGGAGDA